MIVIDVGCFQHKSDESIYKLAEAFKPEVLFGFDPYPALIPGWEKWPPYPPPTRKRQPILDPTYIFRSRMAAWTYNGFVSFTVDDPICAGVVEEGTSAAAVPCFDFAAWLKTLPMPEVEVVLKLDCEGCEYPLTRAIVEHGLDLLLHGALIEYHDEEYAHGWYESEPVKLRCPVDDWSDW